jgi:RNA polymerase sigma factor (sigma-70 family)
MSERIGEFDPARGSFLQWLNYAMLTAFCVEVGCRTPAQLKRPENHAQSLSGPVGGENEEITLEEVLEDPGGVLALDAVLEGVYNAQAARIVGQALDKLPERQRAVIRGRYYEGKTLREISAAVGVSVSAIQQEEHYAFRQLRKDRELWRLRDFNPYRGTGLNAWRQTGSSIQERIAMELEALEELRKLRG